jgi:serine/threonine-protein kinase
MTSIAADIDPAVENVIRRCLDPDPLRRPETALLVAAALPGGDPLAAALAAGETPSPELVASAGKTEGIAVRYAAACLVTILICIGAIPAARSGRLPDHSQLPAGRTETEGPRNSCDIRFYAAPRRYRVLDV